MNVMTITKFSLTPKEKHVLGNYIVAHCSIPEGQRYARWDVESGGSDLTVVDRLRPLIPKLTVFHVRYLRQKFDLPIEPQRYLFVKPRESGKLTELQELRDKVEALVMHVKECDVRLRDYNERLTALEDKYTAPKR